jgi:hypothetical protein
MPDTPGKRQRDTMKIKRRQAKEERRAARKTAQQDPLPAADDDEQAEDQPIDTGGQADDGGEPRD